MKGEIETVTKMDLQLTENMAKISTSLDFIASAQKEGFSSTNDHLKTLNGKVLKQEFELDSFNRRLNDLDGFKKAVEQSAGEKAKEAGRRAASVRSLIISIVVPIIVMLLAYLIQTTFHINLSNF